METTEEDKKKAAKKAYNQAYYIKNGEKLKEYARNYGKDTYESIKEYKKDYAKENAESISKVKKVYRQKNKKYFDDRNKKYYKENCEVIKEQTKKYKRDRRRSDPLFKMIDNVRNRLYCFFRSRNFKKTKRTFDCVGCTPEFLMEHLVSQFKEGMTRHNHGPKGWHIDHIIPLASSGYDKEKAEKLCHYTNLQPLWWYENMSKGDKIIPEVR